MKSSLLAFLALLAPASLAQSTAGTGPPVIKKSRPPQQEILPSLADVQAAARVAKVSSPTSDVKGLAFDRIIQIWLENTNYAAAAGDDNFKWLASQGILLKNYFSVTHPSQPNYAAVAAGDHFGMDSGDMFRFPANVSTVVDLLDTKNISWGAYQESMPYAGFQGFRFARQSDNANDYMRKHNPLILFDSIANNPQRASQVKNLTSFRSDLAGRTLPQWAFITPNMTNDGHDTNYRFAARWTRSFLEPLLADDYFMNRTLVVVSFDECEVYQEQNRVFTVLLGGAVPSALRGTADDGFYNHYSTIASVSANWGLPSLGRWDCGANILALVANKTNYTNVMPNASAGRTLAGLYFNTSYPGPASNKLYTPGWWPVPDTSSSCSAGHGVLQSVKDTWKGLPGPAFNYTDAFPYDTRSSNNVAVPAAKGVMSVSGPAAPNSGPVQAQGGADALRSGGAVGFAASAMLFFGLL